MSARFDELLTQIRTCRLCADDMRRAPGPVLQASATALIHIAGQAPGNLAANTGIPFNDPSGDRLRDWMGVTREEFYDSSRIALIPMGFCFPGYDDNGADLPPMPRCAKVWREELLSAMPRPNITILVGSYAQKWHLGARAKRRLTDTVRAWKEFEKERVFPTPHPSWRNTGWLKRNPWFEAELIPALQAAVRDALKI